MSDPIAAAILSKLTSYYPMDGNLNDVHGSNPLTADVVSQGYEPGKSGQRLKGGARARAALTSSVPVDSTTQLCIGGWMVYGGSGDPAGSMSLSFDTGPFNEVLTVHAAKASAVISAASWASAPTLYAADSGALGQSYPVRIRVEDSAGNHAEAARTITIMNAGGMQQGYTYFAIAVFDGNEQHIFVDGLLRGSATPPRPPITKPSVSHIQIGNVHNSATTRHALEEVMVCIGSTFNAEEIAWLYNEGMGRTYADIVSAAA